MRVVRPDGLICIDYRDGTELLREKRHFEFRGAGYDKASRKLFVSYYRVRHARTVDLPYHVRAVVLRLGFGIRFEHIDIHSHYVVPEQIVTTVRDSGCEILSIPVLLGRGLPCLKTLLAVKIGREQIT